MRELKRAVRALGSKRGWKETFYLALAVTLALLLAPGDAILRGKIWLAHWLPFGSALDQFDATRFSDKLVHGSLFLMLGALATYIWWRLPVFRWVILGLVALGAGTEVLQHFIPGRGSDPLDFVADMVGLAIGHLWLRSMRAREPAA